MTKFLETNLNMPEKRILAVIPARGGSKRLPGKNLIELNGKPLIAWSIEAARNSKYIESDDIIVTTDSKEIATVAKQYGAHVPFMRPKNLSSDGASSTDVVIHTIEFLKSKGREYDYVILLQPTSPLRDAKEIDNAIELLYEKEADAIISVCPTEHSPLWANTLPQDLSMHLFVPKQSQKRSQELSTFYRLNGAIYLVDVLQLLQKKTFFLDNSIYAYIMSNEKSVDIDTKLDLLYAKAIVDAIGVF